LNPGQTSVKEFTPTKPGKYKFSCWMGMISGIIEVVDKGNAVSQDNVINSNKNSLTPAGSEGSGGSCGVNGGCSCGRR
jgi:plastocyanin domain-containing protein